MKNTIRAALVAGLIGSAAIGLAGGASAAVTPGHQDWATGVPAAHSQQFSGHKADDDDSSGDVAAFDNDYDMPAAPADSEPEAPVDMPEEPAEAPADVPEEPAEAPADSAPEEPADVPAEAPADSTPEEPADVPGDAPADSVPEAPADAPAEAPADIPDSTPVADAPSPHDVDVADDAEPVLADPEPAQQADVEQISELVTQAMTSDSTVAAGEWNREVTTWDSSWVSYDTYNRPVILNPYNNPLQLVYTYGNAPRIVTVPPLQRVVLNTPAAGVYPFTAVVASPSGPIRQVSVGSFTGGAPKPAPPAALKNVLVQLRYSTGISQPFRVKTLVDLGDDNTMGARRVLIDGVDTAWGQWSKNASGERQFEITKTLQLPGLAAPSEGPLPGYNVAVAKR
ncbi:hypothetical protein H7J93_08080 [Mycobacterium barrassiae]|uniref:hypothetical protein n=1 Tax=Mycobacterium barrassiae TaxID=319709 RepID=UPI0022658EA3|nr:hypothetical protein [Mycobacterium barrassiae]MCV7299590.1 hypothetical protein [Mycobacterium barrassiae]